MVFTSRLELQYLDPNYDVSIIGIKYTNFDESHSAQYSIHSTQHNLPEPARKTHLLRDAGNDLKYEGFKVRFDNNSTF